MRLKIIASSSSGNCALVETAGLRFLIDAGLSFKKLSAALSEEDLTPEAIDAVFVTHEHSDHVIGLSGFAALRTPVYATRGTISGVTGSQKINWQVIPSAAKFKVGGASFIAESFSIPHDATEPIGFAFDDGEERLVWALDVGHLDVRLKKIFQSATTLVMESNYCEDMLEADTRRPFSLKQRIRGRHGHLSNDETFEFLTSARSPSWKRIVLAHVSRNCNHVGKLEARYTSMGLPVEVFDPMLVCA